MEQAPLLAAQVPQPNREALQPRKRNGFRGFPHAPDRQAGRVTSNHLCCAGKEGLATKIKTLLGNRLLFKQHIHWLTGAALSPGKAPVALSPRCLPTYFPSSEEQLPACPAPLGSLPAWPVGCEGPGLQVS